MSINTITLKNPGKNTPVRIFIFTALFILSADFVYKTLYNITYINRDQCFLYKSLPKIGFLSYEYFIELPLIVLLGILVSVMLESYFSRYRRFYPRNPVTSFVYASVIPICACGVLPLTVSMKESLNFRTIITFVVAAPLLNPYIIMMSFFTLGAEYGILRIASSFILAVSSGYVLEFFHKREMGMQYASALGCKPQSCSKVSGDTYTKTWSIFKQVLPYLVLAGIFGILMELYMPLNLLKDKFADHGTLGLILSIIVGIPVYLCNGAEVLFLRPLINCGGLSQGAAVAFSLTSTAICLTSIVMLTKFIGKKLTVILTIHIMVMTFLIGVVIDVFK